MKRTIACLIILILLPLLLGSAAAQPQQAVIRVLDPLGNPVPRAEVILTHGEELYRFVTNSTGHALFLDLPQALYNVSVRLGGVTVASGQLNYPQERTLTMTAQIAKINVTAVNMDGEPVEKVGFKLLSLGGAFNSTAVSDKSGKAYFVNIPYSSLEGVGDYKLEAWWEGAKLLTEDVRVSEPLLNLSLTLPLLNLNVTITNLEGENVPKVGVVLKAGNLTFSGSAPEGLATFSNLPSSDVEGVGEYLINVTMRTRVGDLPIYSETRAITSSQSLYLVAELAKLEVRVVDEDGEPVKGVAITVSNKLAANFTTLPVNVNGTALVENLPLSTGKIRAGTYIIQVFRRGRKIGEAETLIERPRAELKVEVNRATATLLLRDYGGAPLTGYKLTVSDQATGEHYEAVTDSQGAARFKLFYGTYLLEVVGEDHLVYRGSVDISAKEVEVKVESVNFPYRIELRDGFGAPLNGVHVKIYADEQPIYDAVADGSPISLKLPYPGKLRVDLYDPSGSLIHRVTLDARGPGRHVVRLKAYVNLGGGLVSLDDLGFSASLAALAAAAILAGYSTYRAAKPRRQT